MPNAYALSGSTLVTLDSATLAVGSAVTVNGVAAGEALVGIDFRPQNGFLYGLGVNAAADTGTLYAISVRTGVAAAVGTPGQIAFVDGSGNPVDLPAGGYGFDFNPAVDRIRVTTESGLNFRLNPNNGAAVDGNLGGAGAVAGVNPDGPIAAGATVSGAAYTNNLPNTSVTTLYTLDAAGNLLSVQNPPNLGTQSASVAVTLNGNPLDFTAVPGFDIPTGVNVAANNAAATSGVGLALLTVGGTTSLFRIDLATGAATAVSGFGVSGVPVGGFAIQNDLIGIPAVGLSADGGSLLRFNTAFAGTAASVAVSGVAAGEQLVGLDIRPQTGQLFALGVNATADTGSLYLVDPQTGGATLVGAAGQVAFVDASGNPVDLPTGGYGFDFNPTVDRIRVTTETGLNFRLNPNNGAAVDGNLGATGPVPAGTNADGPINGLPAGSTGISAAAYTNSSAGQSVTTLFTLDAASDSLFIQNPANSGTQTGRLAVTLGGSPLDFTAVSGFDIPAGIAASATNAAPAYGSGFAALTVGGSTGLYAIDLTTGVATSLGAIGTGATALAGLALADSATTPRITSDGAGIAATLTLAENTRAVTKVVAVDPDGPGLTYSLAGGADAARFTIDAATGALAFVAAPDFEARASSAGTNSYAVTVRASDGAGGIDTQALTVNVTDVNGAPNFGTLVTDPDAPLAPLLRLYDTAFDRAGDVRGLETWADQIEGGTSLAGVAAAFIQSAEFTSRFGPSLNNHDFVDVLYANAFGRDSDADPGSQSWVNVLNQGASRAEVALAISESAEHRASSPIGSGNPTYVPNQESSDVARLYYALLDRSPDLPGFQSWVAREEAGTSVQQIATFFLASPEGQGRLGGLNDHDFVDALYSSALGRDSDLDPGSQSWLNALNSGASRADVAIGIGQAPEAISFLAPRIDDGLLLS